MGSANFSQKYGINSQKVNLSEIKKIFYLAKKNNISFLDTADNYLKDSSALRLIRKKFKIISKIKPDEKWKDFQFSKNEIIAQTKKLNNDIEVLLFHDVNILFTKYGEKIFNNLVILKKQGYLKKIGVSIYDTKCLKYLTSKYDLNVVQCPYNILNKEIIENGWLKKIKKMNIEIHVRSIFLQGLLVNKEFSKKNYFKKYRVKLIKWFKYLDSNKISPIEYIMNDLIDKNFDKIIIGINSFDNLKEIINFRVKKEKFKKIKKLVINDKSLVDPRKWK